MKRFPVAFWGFRGGGRGKRGANPAPVPASPQPGGVALWMGRSRRRLHAPFCLCDVAMGYNGGCRSGVRRDSLPIARDCT